MNLTELTASTNYDHSRNVSIISGVLAKHIGYVAEEIAIIEEAALYHDIGKQEIPASILRKPGALTPQEFEIIKTHTRIGCDRIAEALRLLSAAATVAAEHHEKLDGSGYMGLSGAEIHPYAKLVAVADVFDALLSRRAYKPAWEPGEVLQYMHGQAGTHFDREIVAVLLAHADEIMRIYGQ